MDYIKYTPELSNNWSRAQQHISKHTPSLIQRVASSMTTSQLQSKFWLGAEIKNLNIQFNNTAVIGGWYCHILAEVLIGNLNIGFVCNYDIDRDVQIGSYKFNRRYKDSGKYLSSRRNLFLQNIEGRQLYNECGPLDLIVNPSCEHMWYMSKLKEKHFTNFKEMPVWALQSTDEEKYDDHINCVSGPDELADQAGMTHVYYSGTKILDSGMKRFMVIGR